jgi:hypothetical protein
MTSPFRLAFCLALTLVASTVPTQAASSVDSGPADLTLGGLFILRIWGGMGHMTAQERVDQMESRLSPILGNAIIAPEDVVVYNPKKPPYPVIYVFGRRFATVDAATAKANGGTPQQVAVKWAKRLQQVLPKLNWRPANAPEPVIPPNPPMTITDQLAEVGGREGVVTVRGKKVFRLVGLQPDGLTAAERADLIQARLNQALVASNGGDEPAIKIVPSQLNPEARELIVNDAPVIEVTRSMVVAAKLPASDVLAGVWKKNIRWALGLSPIEAAIKPLEAATTTESVPTETPGPAPAP